MDEPLDLRLVRFNSILCSTSNDYTILCMAYCSQHKSNEQFTSDLNMEPPHRLSAASQLLFSGKPIEKASSVGVGKGEVFKFPEILYVEQALRPKLTGSSGREEGVVLYFSPQPTSQSWGFFISIGDTAQDLKTVSSHFALLGELYLG